MISCAILSFLFVLGFAFPVVAATVPEDEISPLGTCSNHIFEFRGYHAGNNEHTFVCANEGCTAYLVEECYFHGFCGDYSNQTSIDCERCGHGTVSIHSPYANYYYYMIEGYHTWVCQNVDEYGSQCFWVGEDLEPCDLDAIKIWRYYDTNDGHPKTRECLTCHYEYNVGYEDPVGHPEYFSETNDCEICQLDEPYWMYASDYNPSR